jgi:heptosyltransferase III
VLSIVYHCGALGDFLTILPAVERWNNRNGNVHKILLGKPSIGILGVHAGLFDEIWDVQSASFSWLYSPEMPIRQPLLEKIPLISAALLYAAQDSPVLSRFQRERIDNLLFQDPFPGDRTHIVSYHISLVNIEPLMGDPVIPRCPQHPGYKHEADRALGRSGPFIAIHPGSGSERKNWPSRYFLQLAAFLAGDGHAIVWVFGPADTLFPVPPGDRLIINVSLPVLVHVFSRCSLYIGNDSGVSHLAAASGAPCIVLFGPSDPEVWRPTGINAVIIQKSAGSSMDGIKVADVLPKCRQIIN